MRASDTVVVMNEGRVIASGPPAAVRNDARVLDAYLDGAVTLLEIDGVEAGYGDATVLHGVSVRADAGELVSHRRAPTAPASRRC